MHGPFFVLHLLLLSRLLFLRTRHYIETSNFWTNLLLSFSAIYQHHPGSLLSLLSLDVIVHHFEHVIASSIPLPLGPSAPSSQQIPRLGSIHHSFSQLLLFITQDIKENHTVMSTSASATFWSLISDSQEVILLTFVLPCLIPSPTSLVNNSNPMALLILTLSLIIF